MPNTQELSAYERQRARNIARNSAVLASLKIPELAEAIKQRAPKPKRNISKVSKNKPKPAPTRSSSRVRGLEVVPTVLEEREASNESEKGARAKDGRWTGERFGEVAGVDVGHVFGPGDFQRLGRQEMTDTGFFRPFVTPEFIGPGEGCYAIILNNDNGLSKDEGNRILYAGSGGRRRGQNRTAPQCFDQSWDNVTNQALRLNNETGKPVRVIRGPKLEGEFGTARQGGGYRYDGLYRVTEAKMMPTGSKKLDTAFFTLQKNK